MDCLDSNAGTGSQWSMIDQPKYAEGAEPPEATGIASSFLLVLVSSEPILLL